MRRAAALALVLLCAAPGAVAAQAPDTRGVSVLPRADSPYRSESGQFLELGELAAGTVLEDTVVLVNASDEQRTVLLFPADATPAVGGGFAYSSRRDVPTQFGAWVRLSQREVTLAPQQRVPVELEVRVPPGAEGGEYRGGVVVDPVVEQQGPISTTTRYAMPVLLTVAGAPPGTTPGRGSPDGRLRLDEVRLVVQDDRLCPEVRYSNDSQDVLDPVAQVRVDRLLGGDQTRQQAGVGAVPPGGSGTARLECVRRPLGPAQLEVVVSSPRGEDAETVSATWLPWPLRFALLALLLLLAALLLLLLRGLRRRKADGAEPDALPPSHN